MFGSDLHSKHESTRREAYRQLASTNTNESAQKLTRLLRDQPTTKWDDTDSILYALSDMHAPLADEAILEFARDVFAKRKATRAVSDVIKALSRVDGANDIMHVVLEEWTRPRKSDDRTSVSDRDWAIRYLAERKDSKLASILIILLPRETYDPQDVILKALVKLGDPAVVPSLVTFLNTSKDPKSRAATISALQALGFKDASVIGPLRNDHSQVVRDAAQRLLAAAGWEGSTSLDLVNAALDRRAWLDAATIGFIAVRPMLRRAEGLWLCADSKQEGEDAAAGFELLVQRYGAAMDVEDLRFLAAIGDWKYRAKVTETRYIEDTHEFVHEEMDSYHYVSLDQCRDRAREFLKTRS
jgi:hypothetical protein